jgi:hypothetical protein
MKHPGWFVTIFMGMMEAMEYWNDGYIPLLVFLHSINICHKGTKTQADFAIVALVTTAERKCLLFSLCDLVA